MPKKKGYKQIERGVAIPNISTINK